MRLFQTTTILLTAMAVSFSANAGQFAQAGAYQTENSVKIYRYGPTNAQKQANQMRYQQALAIKAQAARNQAILQQAKAQQAAFERGFVQGQKTAKQETRPHRHSQRSRYGRRYSTGFYGTQFGSYNRPLHLRRRSVKSKN